MHGFILNLFALFQLIQLICVFTFFTMLKVFFTSLFTISFLAAHAQKFEVGINGGASNPVRVNESQYSGHNGKWKLNTGINFHYNLNSHFQIGGDVSMTQWERTADWNLYAPGDQYLGTREVSYLLAKRAYSATLRFNYVIPFYPKYDDFIRSSVYFGVSLGGVVTSGNGAIEYSRYNPNTPAEYSYVSRYNFERGYGSTIGAQVGYTYYFSQLLGLNVEFAPKIAWVKTIDSHYAYANDTYNVLQLPVTVGIRLRFGSYGY